MRYVIVYYTQEPKAPVIYHERDMVDMLMEIVRLTQLKAKFCVFRLGECVGDFS